MDRMGLALMANLDGAVLAQEIGRLGGSVWCGDDPDAVVAVAEAWVVTHGHRESRDASEREHAEHGGERADEHHQLEADDGVRYPARHRLAADDDGPVIRDPDRDPVAERESGEAADQREDAHLAVRRLERVLELVARRGR